ncbi:DNA-binding transcriptional regulator, MocR family, contains an aminotransferase domain [Dyadobacter koreensis]|uniref:DNA-binding transcriptional regulator, MocR family, contains an aminotransferase domain n=1 Tax=Dyadobacter koreensis TaxID=408657 RepID=A0A1H6V602_9BACT|nr:PLP-dependent aminotransferase family protein [Dyadobacter koreensis]SEI97247.1 DNA-binding transcriptional regulator, MocR family, contains an aminotransferase domain [Dyadobacter koreensis]
MQETLSKDDFLYMAVAERFENQIEKNILKTGDKLISLRALSKEQGISISTAYKAYIELENKGFIEARPKSGYFVRFSPSQYLKTPDSPKPSSGLVKVDVEEMLRIVYKTLSQEGVVKLATATPSRELIPEAKLNKAMMEAIRRSPNSCTAYEDVQGNLTLRKQIAKYAFNWNGNITSDDVVTSQGCMEALGFCLKAVTQPGDTVAMESPTYFGIFNVMTSLGLKVLEIPTDAETGVDIEYLENALHTNPVKACLFVPNFGNPSGGLMPDHRKKQLVELLAKHQIPLIEDDIYGEMYFGKTRPKTCKSYDKEGLVMLCSSISKTLAPGYRVGWCIPGKFMDKIISIKLNSTVSSATPTQAAVGLFFETGRYDLHMRKMRKALHTQCLRYIQAISDYFPKDTKVSRPQGGYVLWIEMNKNVNAFELFEKALQEKVSIAPGQIFSTDARFTNYIRISFGAPYSEFIDKSLKKLGKIVESLR